MVSSLTSALIFSSAVAVLEGPNTPTVYPFTSKFCLNLSKLSSRTKKPYSVFNMGGEKYNVLARSSFQPITNRPCAVPLATSSCVRLQGSKCIEQSTFNSLHNF